MSEFVFPHHHGGGVAGYGLSLAAWFAMMVVMMLPAVMPWMRVFGKMAADAFPGRRPAVLVTQFIGGYFAAWLLYSAAAAATQLGLQQATLLGADLRLQTTAGGVLLLGAGAFQLTPLKEACLAHCRSPMSFFLERWDGGPNGPFNMGVRHGTWCVACCWALMALSFVLGIMNLLWMALLAAVVTIEQVAPGGRRCARVFGVAFAMWGIWLLAAASR